MRFVYGSGGGILRRRRLTKEEVELGICLVELQVGKNRVYDLHRVQTVQCQASPSLQYRRATGTGCCINNIKMADYARMVLDHYQLQDAYPVEWPAEKDLSDASDDEDSKPRRNGVSRKSKSNRYSALERTTSDRRSLPGSQRTGDGVENLVQRDEPDPLGSTDSVVRIIRQQGLPIQDDPRLSWYTPSIYSK